MTLFMASTFLPVEMRPRNSRSICAGKLMVFVFSLYGKGETTFFLSRAKTFSSTTKIAFNTGLGNPDNREFFTSLLLHASRTPQRGVYPSAPQPGTKESETFLGQYSPSDSMMISVVIFQ